MITKAMKSSIASLFMIILCALIGGGCPGEESKGPVATGLGISSPDYAVAGDPITVTIRAIDSGGKTVASYSGTVQFSSSDTEAVLPDNYTFLTTDEGVHTFTALTTLKTSGPQTLTVASGSDFSASKTIIVTGGALNELVISAPITTVTSGVFVTFVVTPKDSYGNTITTYTGSVTFTSTDSEAILPETYTFEPSEDNGMHTISGIFGSWGTQNICVKDTLAGIQKCTSIFVYFAADPNFAIGLSSSMCTPDCPPFMAGIYHLQVFLANPSTGVPLSGENLTATISGCPFCLWSKSEKGNGQYLMDILVPIPSDFYVSINCTSLDCSGFPTIFSAGKGFTMAVIYPTKCSVDAFGTPPEVGVINEQAGTTNTTSSFTVKLRDIVGNPVLTGYLDPNMTGGQAQLFTVTGVIDGDNNFFYYDIYSEVAQFSPKADGLDLTSVPVTITYTSLNFVDLSYTPIVVLEVPTGTTNLWAQLMVGGAPTDGRTVTMAVSAGSASIGTVTDTNGDGTYRADLTDNAGETVTVIASESESGAKGIIEVTFVEITITAITGTTIGPGDGVTVTATIKGPSPKTGRTVNLTTNSSGCTPTKVGCGPVGMTDNGDGTYSIVEITDVPETVTFTASDQSSGATATIDVTFQ